MNRRRFLQCAATGLFVPSAMALTPTLRNRMGVVADNPTWTFYTTKTGSWTPSVTKTGVATKWDVSGQVIVSNTPSFTLSSGIKKVKIFINDPITVTKFYITDGSLTGSAPIIDSLANLTDLRISNNSLSGLLPSVSNNKKLSQLRCETNNLSGTIPSFTNCTVFGYFRADANKFTGYTQSTFTTAMQYLNLANNLLTADAVNNILCDINAIGSTGVYTLNLGGTGNAAPTEGPPDGVAAKAALIARSWVVTTN